MLRRAIKNLREVEASVLESIGLKASSIAISSWLGLESIGSIHNDIPFESIP